MSCAKLRVAQHDRDDRVFARQEVEPQPRSRPCAPVGRVFEEPCAQVVARLDQIRSASIPAATIDGRQGVGEEVGPRALAQQVDHRLRPGDIAADRTAQRLAQRAGEDVGADARMGAACPAPSAP